AVNDVVGEEKRDAQSRFLDRNALEAARVRGAMHTQEGADAPRAHVLFAAGTLGRPRIRARPARLVQLAELLLERHQREDRIHELLTTRVRGTVAGLEVRAVIGNGGGGNGGAGRIRGRLWYCGGRRTADRKQQQERAKSGTTLKHALHPSSATAAPRSTPARRAPSGAPRPTLRRPPRPRAARAGAQSHDCQAPEWERVPRSGKDGGSAPSGCRRTPRARRPQGSSAPPRRTRAARRSPSRRSPQTPRSVAPPGGAAPARPRGRPLP